VDTFGLHGSGGILTHIGTPGVNGSLTINLEAETGGLSLDPAVNGPVTLTLTPPPGVRPVVVPGVGGPRGRLGDLLRQVSRRRLLAHRGARAERQPRLGDGGRERQSRHRPLAIQRDAEARRRR
jgi:hypothetical protein